MSLDFVGQPSTINFMASHITKSLSATFLISSRQTSDTGQERMTSLTYISTSLTVRLSSLSQVGKGCLERPPVTANSFPGTYCAFGYYLIILINNR